VRKTSEYLSKSLRTSGKCRCTLYPYAQQFWQRSHEIALVVEGTRSIMFVKETKTLDIRRITMKATDCMKEHTLRGFIEVLL